MHLFETEDIPTGVGKKGSLNTAKAEAIASRGEVNIGDEIELGGETVGAISRLLPQPYRTMGEVLALALMSIFQKAGYSRWLGLLIIVPVANIVVFLLLVFGDWPVHR